MALTKAKLIADGVIDVDNLAAGHSITTSNIGEGSNLYYTDGRVASYLTTNSYATESFVTTGYLPLSGGTVSGNLTVTGSLTGTLATAAQTNITSVGTLSSLAVSGDVSIADKIIHTGDTNTAIRFPAADTVTVETDGTERVRVDSSGNVGIGTNSPAEKLHLYQSVANNELLKIEQGATGSGAQIQFANIHNASCYLGVSGNTDGDFIYYNGATTNNIFYTSDTERMRITSDGYLRMASGSGGIQFGGDTAAANALDDYEEGTWTATLTPSTSGSITVTPTVRYTKIGRQVFVQGMVSVTGLSSAVGTSVELSFPFMVSGTNEIGRTIGSIIFADASASFARTSKANFTRGGDLFIRIDLDASTLAVGDEIMFGITYNT